MHVGLVHRAASPWATVPECKPKYYLLLSWVQCTFSRSPQLRVSLYVIVLSPLASLVNASHRMQQIQVGQSTSGVNGALQFNPPNITAPNGTIVTFQWLSSSGNHTATQSSFASPCTPLVDGFDSGFLVVPSDDFDGANTWSVIVENDQERQ